MRLLIILFLSFFFVSCVFKEQNKNTFQVVELNSKAEFFNLETKSIGAFSNFVRIVYKGDYRLYLVPTLRTYTDLTLSDKAINEQASRIDTIYEVFAIRNGDKKGLKYSLNNFKKEKGKVFDIDSAKEELTLSLTDKDYETFNYELGNPAGVFKNGKILIEKFAIKKTGVDDIDSIYRYYNEGYKDIDFSFSKKLDQQKKSKLYKTLFVYNAIPKGINSTDVAIPRREFFRGMAKVSDKRTGIFNEIIEKFKEDRLIK